MLAKRYDDVLSTVCDFVSWICTVKCENTVAEVYESASITCVATGITGGVDVSIEWYRGEGDLEGENHQFTADKHKGTLKILQVGEYLQY